MIALPIYVKAPGKESIPKDMETMAADRGSSNIAFETSIGLVSAIEIEMNPFPITPPAIPRPINT